MPKRPIMSTQRKVTELIFHVDGTGTAALSVGSEHGTLTDNGTGDYTVALTDTPVRVVAAFVTPITEDVVAAVTALSTASVTVKTKTNAGTPAAADADFYLRVLVANSEKET